MAEPTPKPETPSAPTPKAAAPTLTPEAKRAVHAYLLKLSSAVLVSGAALLYAAWTHIGDRAEAVALQQVQGRNEQLEQAYKTSFTNLRDMVKVQATKVSDAYGEASTELGKAQERLRAAQEATLAVEKLNAEVAASLKGLQAQVAALRRQADDLRQKVDTLSGLASVSSEQLAGVALILEASKDPELVRQVRSLEGRADELDAIVVKLGRVGTRHEILLRPHGLNERIASGAPLPELTRLLNSRGFSAFEARLMALDQATLDAYHAAKAERGD